MTFLKRFFRHVAMTPWQARRAFPAADLEAIEREIGVSEKRHRGEVRFVVEAELTTGQLWAGLGSRARAIEVFSRLQVWDTEENTGILIYVLLADRRVEIVADRGIQARVAAEQWKAIARTMEERFREGKYLEGALAGVHAASTLLETHFPQVGPETNELPNRPVLL